MYPAKVGTRMTSEGSSINDLLSSSHSLFPSCMESICMVHNFSSQFFHKKAKQRNAWLEGKSTEQTLFG
jgi:hypothetical protein